MSIYDQSRFPLVRGTHANFTLEEAKAAWNVVLGDRHIPPLIDGFEDHELMPGPQGGWMLRDPVRWAEYLAERGLKPEVRNSSRRPKYARIRRIGER